MSSRVPDPPSSDSLNPLLFTWEKDRLLFRCHNVRFGPAQFNPGLGLGRFHPFRDARGNAVPTLYTADGLEGALSETVFHSVPVRGSGRAIRRITLKPLVVSTLICHRELRLVQLFGFGLRRLGLTRLKLIEVTKRLYPRTAAWAQVLHGCDERIDGLIWVSRQNDSARSLVLFGDRVSSSDLRVTGSSLPLDSGAGYEAVGSAADKAGLLIFD